jgi:hypothetical protein
MDARGALSCRRGGPEAVVLGTYGGLGVRPRRSGWQGAHRQRPTAWLTMQSAAN